jgi:hypothetical protein
MLLSRLLNALKKLDLLRLRLVRRIPMRVPLRFRLETL